MEMMLKTIVLLPLFTALLSGFCHKSLGDWASRIVTTGALFFIAFLSWIVFFAYDFSEGAETITLFRFIHSGDFQADWAIRVDRLTQIMLVVVTSVSALVHLYSNGYMAHDHNFKEDESYRPRFFAYLSFFTFAMLMLVTADNLIQCFFGWEGVGVASYLLIGFYYRKQSAGAASMKAFIMNRVGDFGLALGIFGLFFVTGSVQFDDLFAQGSTLAATTVPFLWMDINAAELFTFLLFVGAMGKSAQFFLHTWLPDAMEGPTPVSALIHAATMVTAGVFLVCRFSPLFEYAPGTLTFITIIGAVTAFFAATIGLVQNDIKRVIAFSTCSQLGYMFVAAGVGVYEAAMFHLFTHAFFKAMLFLGAGSVIHAMHHEQDMRNYGGLRHKLPKTFWAMMIGTLAITGVGIPLTTIGFSGFLSKDAIVESAFAGGTSAAMFAYWSLVVAAAMTSFYSWRLMFLTFYGKPRGDEHTHEHADEHHKAMLIPLAVLALGATFAGMIWYDNFFGATGAKEWFGVAVFSVDNQHTLHAAHEVSKWVKISPFLAMAVGFILAYTMYIAKPSWPAKLVEVQPQLYRFLVNKWYIDEIYNAVFLRPALWLGNFFWKKGDIGTIDRFLNWIAMGLVPSLTRKVSAVQSGLVYAYAFAMILGLLVILTWLALTY